MIPHVWKPDRLEYQVALVAAAPTNEPVVIAAQPGSTGDFNWQALESPPNLQPASTFLLALCAARRAA